MINIRQSFPAKVVLWVLGLAIPIFMASVGVLFWQSRKMVRDEAVDLANGVLNHAMHRIRRYLITVETATNTHARVAEQSLVADSLLHLSNRITQMNPFVDGCAISTEPHVVSGYPDRFMAYSIREKGGVTTTLETDYNYFGRRWYSVPRAQQKPGWVVYYDEDNTLDLKEDGMMAAYSHPLYDAKKRFLGLITIEMSLLHISQVLAEEKPYPHSYFIMIDEQGRYVGHPDSTRLFSKTIFSGADPQRQSDLLALGYEMTKGNTGCMQVRLQDKLSLVSYMPVAGTNWSLAIVCPDSDILSGYYRLTYIVLVLLFIGLVIIVVNCYEAVTVSLRPLGELLTQARAVSQGHLDVDIPHTNRIDVIGGLQNSFSTMLKSLNYYIDSVRAATDQNKRYNRELEHTTQLVVEAERRKTIFIQNVTHQVRTPLNIIMGFAQVLNSPVGNGSLNEELGEEEIRGIALTMDHNSKLLVRMVMMLFDSSDTGKAETEGRDTCELIVCNEAAREAVDFINAHTPEVTIGFQTDVPDDLCLSTNRQLLVFSLQELLNNSVRYSDGQHILLQVVGTDTSVRFIVQDTGKGIAEADREHLFEFFTKVDDFSEGLGLGLPLTKRHAQTLGGNFYLDTTYHEGCRFVFELYHNQSSSSAS